MSQKDDNRSKAYNDDKRELLKLKQGLIEESETIKEEENGYGDKGVYEVAGVKNKISNFFYHYKWHVIVIFFITLVASFLIITTVTKKKGDIRILAFSNEPNTASSLYYKSKDMENAFLSYTRDFDNNGYTHIEFYYINLVEEQDYNYYYANQTKFSSEVGLGTAHIYIANMDMFKSMLGNQTEGEAFTDLSELYPDNPNVVDKYYYKVKGSKLAEAAMYVESCPEDMYIALRNENFRGFNQISDSDNSEYHSRALEVLDNIMADRKVAE